MANSRPRGSAPDLEIKELPDSLPILPLDGAVFFPGGLLPVAIGRKRSVALVKQLMGEEQPLLGVVSADRAEGDEVGADNLSSVGTIARVLKLVPLADDKYTVVLQGLARFRLQAVLQEEPYFVARVELVQEPPTSAGDAGLEALAINVRRQAHEVMRLLPDASPDLETSIDAIARPGNLADFIASRLDISKAEKQQVLDTIDVKRRLTLVLEFLNHRREVLKLSREIDTAVKDEMSKTQREFYLRQQLKAIQSELGERPDGSEAADELEERLKEAKLPPEAEKVAAKELARLRSIPAQGQEQTVVRSYLEWLADLPWATVTPDNLDVAHARSVLDGDHQGLEKVKKRILEYLAVRSLKGDLRGPILCLVGPPGVGKTSLGQSIARAMGRKFVRLSLGGVRDEAEIRGHRRTYVGAMPGRFIQSMKRAGTVNPLVMLDEIDKLGADFRGDPAAALLEVLDPEQNNSFSDHYLDVAYDLSKVMFIATANTLDTIPAPLRDRMEVIELQSYTIDEKVAIAHNHLLPKQMREHGLPEGSVKVSAEALAKVVTAFTREAGVRNLERRLAEICRAVAMDAVHGVLTPESPRQIGAPDVNVILGPDQFIDEAALRTEVPGVATGLGWSPIGGSLLFIEATKMPGKGSLILTGQLGEVMKESAQTAMSYLRSKASELGVPPNFLEKADVHLHFPEGATPKDGPSAGVAILTALVSLLTGVRVRSDVAMTGEVTLRGLVLPVGGIKEKVLAAHRAGIKRVILPTRCQKDLLEVPEQARRELEFVFATHMDEVLSAALESRPGSASSAGEPGPKGGARPSLAPESRPAPL